MNTKGTNFRTSPESMSEKQQKIRLYMELYKISLKLRGNEKTAHQEAQKLLDEFKLNSKSENHFVV